MDAQLEKMNAWLIREGELLATEALAAIDRALDRNDNSNSLALVVRHRYGQWGPRIVWVRIGRPLDADSIKRTATNGKVPRETREIPMPTGTWVHLNTFRRLPEPLATELAEIEMRARRLRQIVVRYRRVALALKAEIDGEMEDLPQRRSSSKRKGNGA